MAALKTAQSHNIPARGPAAAASAARERLYLDANINPRTGLATDYLNHFNEAVMVLEMIPDMPECAEDFLGWRPLSYREHFEASNLKAQDLIIQAYDQAEATLRTEFDRVIGAMTSILLAINEGMRSSTQDKTRIALAQQATGWINPLLSLAGGLIHGASDEADVDRIMQK